MDRSWMTIKDYLHPRYLAGVKEFVQFAYLGKDPTYKLPCPCKGCNNFEDQTMEVMKSHLCGGIVESYTRWVYHGERFEDSDEDEDDNIVLDEENSESDDIQEMLNDVGTANFGENWRNSGEHNRDIPNKQEGEASKFLRLLSEAEKSLYPGCDKYSKLSFVVHILHLKTMNRWTCKSIDMLLKFLIQVFPMASIPSSYYDAKNLIRELGLKCEKIHACENDCALYWKENESLDHCPNEKCKAPRYKSPGSKIPRKVLRYFPLKSRLQRLFINKEIAQDMRWHKERRVPKENTMTHPADSIAWKEFDNSHPSFAEDSRNVRLGLSTDGFNPYGNMNNAYSIWPVILVPYNLPPWKCLKDPFFLLSMIIPGPKCIGNDMDIFFRPLIDELKEFFDTGFETYDAAVGEKFMLRAALLWTISDFPAYAYLSGWSTKGYKACPICLDDTTSVYLRNGLKCCYMGHRRFLPADHKWRRERKSFNGKSDLRQPVRTLSGEEIFEQLQEFDQMVFGKAPELLKEKKRKRMQNQSNWLKKSIFFELPYWSTNKIRHNLDIMHIVKNVCEILLATVMGTGHKNRDTWQAREDLKEMRLREELHLQTQGDSKVMPAACYTLSRSEKQKLCQFLSSLKFPDGFASNISHCVKPKECQISGMKSHDYHVFLQRLLPLAIRGMLPKDVSQTLVELSNFFRKICSRTLYVDELDAQEKNIVVILCKLEKIFPPNFFDVMVHLMVHLPAEAKLAGPAQYRWMFPFERKMGQYKGYVHNRARPEGCIVERYLDDECLTFISRYLHNVPTIFNEPERNTERFEAAGKLSIFSGMARPFGAATFCCLSESELMKIHLFILKNCEEIDDYIRMHKELLQQQNVSNVEQMHDLEFPKWFEDRVTYMHTQGRCCDELLSLAKGLDFRVIKYPGCNVNGFRFHTKTREVDRKTQNSGIMVKGEHADVEINFYGAITDILEVEYSFSQSRVVLFKCDWWDLKNSSCLKIDKQSNLSSVNLSKKWYIDQPFVFASQAEQVFYVKCRAPFFDNEL
ncbi:uncharacterized protein LOC113774329 [Coffea eugenioides]|uniref:uncharacterized protein LOC113774329 n=1 Tax=Coffea eugenioides TaxID=49369 RepID=UPI000F607351|nr:uncharacterized protein LOC113774329 [Coffea eugenioides]